MKNIISCTSSHNFKRIFIKILNGLGMNVIAYDLYPNEQAAKEENFTYTTLDEVLEKADVLSLHCPLTPQTRHIINAESLAKVKKGVIIINSARGGLIETEALLDAVKSKQVGGVGLDVYENESSYFFDDKSSQVLEDDVLARLLSFNNVVLTSHQAFLTNEALDNIAEATFNNILSYVKEETLQNEVWYDEENDKIVEGVRVQK